MTPPPDDNDHDAGPHEHRAGPHDHRAGPYGHGESARDPLRGPAGDPPDDAPQNPLGSLPPEPRIVEATPEALFTVADRLKLRVLADVCDAMERAVGGDIFDLTPPDLRTLFEIGMGPAMLARTAESTVRHLIDCFPRTSVLAPRLCSTCGWPKISIYRHQHLAAACALIEQVRAQAAHDDALSMLWLGQDDVDAAWERYPELAEADPDDDPPRVADTLGDVTELDASAILSGHDCHSVDDQHLVYQAMVDHYRDIARELRGDLHPGAAEW